MSVVNTTTSKLTKPKAVPQPTDKTDRVAIPPKKPSQKKSHPKPVKVKKSPNDGHAEVKAPTPLTEPDPVRLVKERKQVLALLQGQDQPKELVREYPFKAKSLELRRRFDDQIARSYVWVPKSPDTFHELLGVISQSTAFLGFEEASIESAHRAHYSTITCVADQAEGGLNLQDGRLSLLWIRPPEYAWSQLRNYLVYRQVDSQHVGIINKWLLIANLKDWDQVHSKFKTQGGARFGSKHFLPETLRLDMPMEELVKILGSENGTYIIKPVRGTKGENMSLLRLSSRHSDNPLPGSNPGSRQQVLLDILKSARLPREHRHSDLILQKYIEHPLLVDKRKFDFRVYMLMVNACRKDAAASGSGVKKAYYVFCHPGFLRLCIMAYKRDSDDLLCHLTNQHQQMRSVLYDQYKEATVWDPDELNQYFNDKGGMPARNYIRDVVYPKIGAIVGYLGAVFAESLNDSAIKASTFKIFGVDFLVDSGLSVQLLEVNELPSWKRQTKVLARLKADLWREAVALTVETVAKFRQSEPLEPLISGCNFRLVHSSEDPALLAEAIARRFS